MGTGHDTVAVFSVLLIKRELFENLEILGTFLFFMSIEFKPQVQDKPPLFTLLPTTYLWYVKNVIGSLSNWHWLLYLIFVASGYQHGLFFLTWPPHKFGKETLLMLHIHCSFIIYPSRTFILYTYPFFCHSSAFNRFVGFQLILSKFYSSIFTLSTREKRGRQDVSIYFLL